MKSSKRILVTGNTGLLGRYIMSRVSDDPDFEAVAFRTANNHRSITDEQDCATAVENIWGVINLASLLPYRNSPVDEMYAVNAVGAEKLYSAALKAGVSKFLQGSTQAVYNITQIPDTGALESSPISPDSDYAKSKLDAEKLLMQNNSGSLLIFRLCALFGDVPSPCTLVESMLSSAIRGEIIEVLGNGNRCYDIISCSDIAEIFMNAIKVDLKGIYNLGRGRAVLVKDIAEGFREISGVNIRYITDKKEKPGYYLNIGKLSKKIRISPTELICGLNGMYRKEKMI